MTHFNSMLDKVEHSISGWHHSRISLVGKSMLINSYIFSISLYYLFAYLVPDTVLEKIAKASRKYFWSKGGDRKGIPSVGWKDITLDLTEKGGGYFDSESQVFKTVFNGQNILWTDILYLKYGKINFWIDPIPGNCSWFFRGLCKTAHILKPNLWMISINVSSTSFMLDHWYFDIPLAYKLTYLNMDMDLLQFLYWI